MFWVNDEWRLCPDSVIFHIQQVTQSHAMVQTISYKQKYVHEVLLNQLVKFAQKSVVRLTDRLEMTIAVDWDIKQQTK